jgi:hypothetical protein
MKVVFFHIPRTAGSTMWHSIANSFSSSGIHILDARHESILKHNCEFHQKEILDAWLSDSEITDVIIHVHDELDLKSRKDIDLVISGTRNMFSWRTSYLSHFIVKSFYNDNQILRKNNCEHQSDCGSQDFSRLFSLKGFLKIISTSLYTWNNLIYENSVKQNYKIILYDESTKSKIDCAIRLEKLMKIDHQELEFTLIRYVNNQELESRSETSHDSRGKVKFFGVLLNIITFPFFVYKNRYFVWESSQKNNQDFLIDLA